jgi:IPT/TIG domain
MKRWALRGIASLVLAAASSVALVGGTGPAGAATPFEFGGKNVQIGMDAAGDIFLDNVALGEVAEIQAKSTSAELLPITTSVFAVDATGDVFAASPSAGIIQELKTGQSTPKEINFPGIIGPTAIAVDAAGDLFVVDSLKVYELAKGTSMPTVLPFAGLINPLGIAVDRTGDVYVADAADDAVFELAAGAPAVTVVPLTGFDSPTAVAVDTAGNLYVNFSEPVPGTRKPVIDFDQVVEYSHRGVQTNLFTTDPGQSGEGVAVDRTGDVFVPAGPNGVDELVAGKTSPEIIPVGPPTVTAVSPSSGPTTGGTAVTITGTGFGTGAVVVIGQGNGSGAGAVAATNVKVVSSSEITATTGAGAKAGTWNLFVKTSGGTNAQTNTSNAANDFTYTAPQVAPTVSSVSPNSGPTTGGTAVAITGTGFVSGSSVVIGQGNGSGTGALAATNVKVVSSTQITAITSGGAKAGTWNLVVLTPGGSSATNPGDYFSYH